jgi:hypothetical protein
MPDRGGGGGGRGRPRVTPVNLVRERRGQQQRYEEREADDGAPAGGKCLERVHPR